MCVCVKSWYVRDWFVRKLCVKLLYVKFVCVKLLYVRDGMWEAAGGGGEGGARDTESKARTPHKVVVKKRDSTRLLTCLLLRLVDVDLHQHLLVGLSPAKNHQIHLLLFLPPLHARSPTDLGHSAQTGQHEGIRSFAGLESLNSSICVKVWW